MIKLALISAVLTMPIKRSLDLGEFGDEIMVTTLPLTSTSKIQRNSLVLRPLETF